MSWESSAEYYRLINQGVRDRLGPLRSAKLLMYSVDFGPIELAQHEGRWDDAAALLEDAARRLQDGGADGVLLCTNTMHKLADRIAAAVRIPFCTLPTRWPMRPGRQATAGWGCWAPASPWSSPSCASACSSRGWR